jgi:hypothetical protein
MKKPKSPKDQPLDCKLSKDGVLSISIGINTLAWALEHEEQNQVWSDSQKKFVGTHTVTNKRAFALDVLRELLDEQEDGTTRVHVFLEDVMESALNNGAQGVDMIDGDTIE